MRVLDLFSGVGMFAYGMEAAGHEVVAFCEIEPWPRRVLNKHWPDVPVYEDVRELTRERLEEDGILEKPAWYRCDCCDDYLCRIHECHAYDCDCGTIDEWCEAGKNPYFEGYKTDIDIITGGFPCQDLSHAGKRAGISGERSGLWSECARLVGELRPKYAIFENVGALLSGSDLVDGPGGLVQRTWFGRVLRDLAEIGYDCEWHCIPAGNPDGLSAGAPHRRERVWIVGYPKGQRVQGHRAGGKQEPHPHDQQGLSVCSGERPGSANRPTQPRMGLLAHGIAARLARSRWLPEPGVGRVATGVPDRVQKLKALGNGLVWQIPYAIGCALMGDHET